MKKTIFIPPILIMIVAMGYMGLPNGDANDIIEDKRKRFQLPADTTKAAFYFSRPDRDLYVCIGDTSQNVFSNSFYLEKWGECFLKISVPATDSTLRLSNDSLRVELPYRDRTFRWYEKDTTGGSLEWDIILRNIPADTQFSFPMSTRNLSFHYQDTLSDWEKSGKAERADSVIGSYAVYHSSKRGGQYKAGKIAHIYRPKAWDSSGDTTWCNLVINEAMDNMSIYVPDAFLRNATYPVTIDPSIGYGDVGSANIELDDSSFANVFTLYEAVAGDRVVAIQINAKSETGGNKDIRVAIYFADVINGYPDTLYGSRATITVKQSQAWHGIAGFANILKAGDPYCVAISELGLTSIRVWYDSGFNNGNSRSNGNLLPDTWAHAAFADLQFSLFATVENLSHARRRKIQLSRIRSIE